MKIQIYEDRIGEWRWRAVEANGRIVATGSEGYTTQRAARRGYDNVKAEFQAEIPIEVQPGDPMPPAPPDDDTNA